MVGICSLCACATVLCHRNPKNSDHPLNGFRQSRFHLDHQKNELTNTFSIFLSIFSPDSPKSQLTTGICEQMMKFWNYLSTVQRTTSPDANAHGYLFLQFERRWRIHCRNMQIIHVCLLLFYIWLAYGNVNRKWMSRCRIELLVCIQRPYTRTLEHMVQILTTTTTTKMNLHAAIGRMGKLHLSAIITIEIMQAHWSVRSPCVQSVFFSFSSFFVNSKRWKTRKYIRL